MNDNYKIAVSIVTYKNSLAGLQKCLDSLLASTIPVKIQVIDNSPTDTIKSICTPEIEYVFNNANLGFGPGHNIAIKKTLEDNIKYHLVLNPDVYFGIDVLEKLYDFMQDRPDVGVVTPKILYPDGSPQHLCKLLPTPFDLLRRRFAPPLQFFNKQNDKYELRFTGYDKTMEIPYLSGCFMFLRTQALKKIGLFDECFFMYIEDTDLTRRLHEYYKTIYFPRVSIYHNYEKGSYKSLKLLKYHIQSAISYFNKWGWLFDIKRKTVNANILKKTCQKHVLEDRLSSAPYNSGHQKEHPYKSVANALLDQTNSPKETSEYVNVKVSVITAVYNGSKTIKNTIDSAKKQDHKNIDHIFIDGNSSDNTIEIINEHMCKNDVLISEPDNGVYEAMNKGIYMAKGEIIAILNADDYYAHDSVVSRMVELIINTV